MNGLDDAFHKFERGRKQLGKFYKHIVKTLNKDRVKFEIKADPYPKPPSDHRNNWKAYTIYCATVPIIPKQDGILLGEVIQSFRSSLDYLAWALVAKHNKRVLTEREKRGIQFPMFHTDKQFKDNVRRILPNIPPKQCALFKMYQPYKRSTSGRIIRCLQLLSNTDKHRIIVPTVLFPESSQGNIKYQGGDLINSFFHLKQGREIKKGTKILTIILAGNAPQQNVRVDTNLVVFPMFPKTIIRSSVPEPIALIEPVLNHIRDICFEILTKFKKDF